ncbi:hypothetical protein [Neolewinella persica]|uniref:hypothetical protein n=1 Tax=Neolewinella persica TaxID=70998 RepID=UPI00037AAF91|nr:hypothetical protein [Neolewinella persica]
MKYLLLLAFTISSLAGFAQVTSASTQYKKLNFESLRMTVDADYEIVAEQWEEFWKERYDVDFDNLDKEKASIAFLADQAAVPIISVKNANLYSKVGGTDISSTVSLAVTYTENDVVTRNTYPQSYVAAEAIMLEFRTYFYTKYFDEQLAEVREALDDIRDDSSDASDDADKARKKIEKYEAKIRKFQDKIDKEREDLGDELETAEEKANRAKELERKLRELERDRARYLKRS